MNTCGACKFKGKPIHRGKLTTRFFLCEKINHNNEYGGHSGNDHAFVTDASDYYAALCVDDDFACNQWEAA